MKKHMPFVEWWPISRPAPYERNPRKISSKAIDKVAASIQEFGFRQPIVVDEAGVVVVGHTRLLAAQRLGLADVPVHVATGLSAAQVKAYRLADNRVGEESAWDDTLLGIELGDLQGLEFDLGITGFDLPELNRALTPDGGGNTDPDDVPEVAPAVSQMGDIWILGTHRLLCGDSTNAEVVSALLAGATPHLMVTDPPYGVDYDPDWRNRADRANGKAYGARAVGRVTNDTRADWREAYALFPGDVTYVWHPPGARQVEFFESLVASGFEVRMQIIWAKSHFPIGRGNYHVQHEPCWYAVRKGKTAHWGGDRKQTTVWQIDKPAKSETGHSTQKPVECMRRPMVNNSKPGDAVYEPFSGSGTTIIAAEMTGRVCHAIEIAPEYVDVAVRRWEAFAGKEATLEADGRTFAEVAAARAKAAAA